MWNFINPNLKRDCPEEKCQQDSLYDQEKRIKTFQESWKAGRPWLQYSTGSEASPSTCKTMTCNYCITFSMVKGSSSATNSFIAGCDNFRIEAIRSHEKSEYHRKRKEFTHAHSLQAGTSIAEKTIQDFDLN